jgi:transmembrane sensor
MLDDTDLARIVRYILGECSPGEAADTQRWIVEDAARVRAVAALEQLWSKRPITPAPPVEEGAWDVDAAWRVFEDASPRGADAPGRRARDRRPLQLVPLSAHATTTRRWKRVAVSIAAALVLSISGSLLWQAMASHDRTGELASTDADTAGMREFRTARAQRAEIRLTDGTLATLAPASRLRVANDYGTGARELYLEGEAYFEVRHDAAHPFRVYTSRGVTEDLGTNFAVRAYMEDSVVRVAVAEGVVRLHAPEGQLRGAQARAVAPQGQHPDTATAGVITAGHVGVLPSTGIPRVRRVADLTPYLAWAGGRLVFRDTPLRDVVTALSRWYGIDMRIADARISRRVYTASFQDEPVSEVLRALETALDLRVERHGNVVVLRARRANTGR